MATGKRLVTALPTARAGSRVAPMWLHIATNSDCFHKEYTDRPFFPCDDKLVAFCGQQMDQVICKINTHT